MNYAWPFILLGFLMLFAIQAIAIIVAFKASSGFEYFRPMGGNPFSNLITKRSLADSEPGSVSCRMPISTVIMPTRGAEGNESVSLAEGQAQALPVTGMKGAIAHAPVVSNDEPGPSAGPVNFDPRSECTAELRDKLSIRFLKSLKALAGHESNIGNRVRYAGTTCQESGHPVAESRDSLAMDSPQHGIAKTQSGRCDAQPLSSASQNNLPETQSHAPDTMRTTSGVAQDGVRHPLSAHSSPLVPEFATTEPGKSRSLPGVLARWLGLHKTVENLRNPK